MPDEQTEPTERTSAARPAAPDATGSGLDATPARDQRADIPARLAAEAYPADVEERGLTEEEVATYRRRVAEGFYNSRDVAAEVARRMLRSRDI